MAKKKTSGKKAASDQPARRSCACVQTHFGLLDTFPEFRANQGRIEHFTRYCMQAGDAAFRAGVITIPVVVHVVYKRSKREHF